MVEAISSHSFELCSLCPTSPSCAASGPNSTYQQSICQNAAPLVRSISEFQLGFGLNTETIGSQSWTQYCSVLGDFVLHGLFRLLGTHLSMGGNGSDRDFGYRWNDYKVSLHVGSYPNGRSDALGHVYAAIGRDWTHLGIAKLYTDIANNGYRMLYLTSRAIGQADSTRGYLKSIVQGNYRLPEGPVIMSPDRLMASLHR